MRNNVYKVVKGAMAKHNRSEVMLSMAIVENMVRVQIRSPPLLALLMHLAGNHFKS